MIDGEFILRDQVVCLARNEFDELWKTSVRLLDMGVKYNRIITVRREDTDKPLSRLNSEERLWIYKKSHCPRCTSKTQSWLLTAVILSLGMLPG